MDSEVDSPMLIGRVEILGKLDKQLTNALAGKGRTVLIGGEAGVGKSRLLAHVKSTATHKQFQIAEGSCFQLDQALPFASMVDLLRELIATDRSAELKQFMLVYRSELARLLPELKASEQDIINRVDLNLEQEKRQVFDRLTQFFLHLASRGALLLIIEDVHWCDAASLDFLAYFSRHIAHRSILVLLTYRSDEVSPELLGLITHLSRDRSTVELTLPRLTRDETWKLLKAILGESFEISIESANSIYDLTEGNPFFVEEIVKSLRATGSLKAYLEAGSRLRNPLLQLPHTVLGVVQQRLKLLGDSALHLLSLAAVAGRQFDFALLQVLTGQDEDTLVRLIKELLVAQLVVEQSAETFAFRHALTREAVYLSLLARERRRLHAMIASAMEQLYADSIDRHFSELTYQFFQAENWPKVLEYAPLAAEQALELFSPRTAVKLYTQALTAAEQVRFPTRWSIYRGRGLAYETIGDFGAALQDYQRALDIASELRLQWQSTLDLGFLWTGRDFGRAGDYLQQALELARTINEPALLGHSLNRVGNWYQNHLEQPDKSISYHREALQDFQAIEDEKGIAASFDLLGTSSYFCGDIIGGARYYEEAIALFKKNDDRQGMVASLVMFATRGANYLHQTAECPVVDLAVTSQDAEYAVQLARELDWKAGESFALSYLAFGLGAQGVYGPALEAAKTALQLAQRIEHYLWIAAAHLALGTLYLDLLDLPRAEDHLTRSIQASRRIETQFVIRMASAFLASTYVQQHELAKAGEVLDTALDWTQPIQTLARRQLLMARAELLFARGDGETALQILGPLGNARVIPAIALGCARILLNVEHLDEAETILSSAEASARLHGLKPLLWRIHAAQASLCEARRDLPGLTQSASAAQSVITALASGMPDEANRRSFTERASAAVPRLPTTSTRYAAQQYYDGLTRRELEIVVLAARGHSNREIALELVISERTVDTHISHILAKLGLPSRRQLAQWAIEKGLLAGPA